MRPGWSETDGIQSRFRVRVAFSRPCSSTSGSSSNRASLCSAPRGRCGSSRRSSPRRRSTSLWTYRQLAALSGRDGIVLSVARDGAARGRALRPAAADAAAQGRRAAAELRRHPARRLAQHAGGRRGRQAAQRVRAATSSARPDAPLLAALGKRFVPRVFRFSSSAERLQSTDDLTFEGTGTRLGDALDRARDELSGLPVAGPRRRDATAPTTPRRTLDESIAGLKAQGMPVFAVGVGKERLTRDVQITRVEMPRRVAQGRLARRRRRRHADRATPARRSRSSSKTTAGS